MNIEEYEERVRSQNLVRLGDLYEGDKEAYFEALYPGMKFIGYRGTILRAVPWPLTTKGEFSPNRMVRITDEESILIAGGGKGTQPYYLPFEKGEGLTILPRKDGDFEDEDEDD